MFENVFTTFGARIAATVVAFLVAVLDQHFGLHLAQTVADQLQTGLAMTTTALMMAVYGVVHRVLSAKFNPQDAAKPGAAS